MQRFKKVAIFGAGLIGGSIALALKKKKLAKTVVGVFRHKESIARAKKAGAIDEGSCDPAIIKGADLLILAAPVSVIIDSAKMLSQFIDKDCLVTDVGSTKGEISSRLSKTFKRFVPSHPLAGSQLRGAANADCRIFKDSICIVTPQSGIKPDDLNRIRALWISIGARVLLVSPKEHDMILGFVSHLPHVCAFSLMNAVPAGELKYAAGGLRDTTRIAASDPGLWADIFLSNSRFIASSIGVFENELRLLKTAIKNKDKAKILKILARAKKKRESLEKTR